MQDLLCPILQLAIILPGILLAYLPMKQHLCTKGKKLVAILVPLLCLLCVIGGVLCYSFHLETLQMMFVLTMIVGIIYIKTLTVSRWKSINVVLAICAAFSCVSSIARALDSMLHPNNTLPWFGLNTIFFFHLMCWGFVALAWHPATHAASELIEEENIAQTWYVFWILPVVFIALNLFMIPIKPGILYQGRILQGYIIISVAFLAILALFYTMFYLMARSMNKNKCLWQENQFLSMEHAQYDSLLFSIEETRQARHDMRHHFNALSALAEQESWADLKQYLNKLQTNIPNTDLMLCDNTIISGVASYYGTLYKQHEIPYSFELDMPATLPVEDMNICVVLSNLLENALEASLRTKENMRRIKVQMYMHSERILLIIVENTFDGIIREKNGKFQSSKRIGDGIGIQSVRQIAETNGGYSRFTYEDGVFCANVMLRGD